MRPVLAANYSAALAGLLAEEPGIVDAVKVSEFNPEYLQDYRLLRAAKPLILHGLAQGAMPGNPGFRAVFDPEILEAAIRETGPAYLSVHLEYWADGGQEQGREAYLSRLAEDLTLLRATTGLPIHLENAHAMRPEPGGLCLAAFVTDPGFITHALDATGSRFLLDLAHARITAWHLGVPLRSYLRDLPLHLVDEVHLVGVEEIAGEPRDKQAEMGGEDYALLSALLQETPVRTVTLEYGGVGPLFAARSDRDALRRQLLRLREICERSA